MIVGNFVGPVIDAVLYGGVLRHGVVCDDNVVDYTDKTLTVLFRGMLYREKKGENEAAVVAGLYREQGLKAFGRLDGSFVVVLLEGEKITVVRDHHGMGGQIYYTDTYFASSLALLQQTPGCPSQVNVSALAEFLSVGYISTGASSFNGISKLPAGHALVVVSGRNLLVNLFDTSSILPVHCETDLETLSCEYGELHKRAIEKRIAHSSQIGMLLSGGYDSGSNLAALRNSHSGNIYTFSIGFKGDTWSELPLARCMSQRFDTIHKEYEIDGSEIDALPSMVRELGDPFVEGGLMVNYTAMRMVSENKPDIVLGGDGSDQYFGTSGREVAMHYLISKFGLKPVAAMVHSILSHEMFEKNGKPYRVRFHLNKILQILQGDLFGFERFRLLSLFCHKEEILQTIPEKSDLRSFEHLYTQHAYRSDLEKVINQVILFKASRMAGLFDVPISFPFMDIELYEFLQQLPVSYKCRGENPWKIAKGASVSKFLLKHHYKPMLPVEITSKKKQGGFAPMPIFFADKQRRDRLADFILQSSMVGELLNRCAVEQFIKTYDRETQRPGNWFWYRQNKAIQYFNLLNLAVWWETYVKKNSSVSF